jgi:hypothetical protein
MSRKTDDRFETYFAEKLWEMIPSTYRYEDGMAENPGVLRALIEVIAQQAAVLRRSQDHLWDDQYIDICENWAIPYIADLLGTRLVSEKNRRGQRVDVAKTIYYRRRKGTLRVLEELIRDITQWEGKVVENFTRLARARHGLDPLPSGLQGYFTGTMPGGWADLRKTCGSVLSGGPFDEFFHTPDVRKHNGKDGRYGIPKLAFHLFTIHSNEINTVTPFKIGNNDDYGFDPSGRSIPLFFPAGRKESFDWDQWHSALEWEMPLPIRCCLLNHLLNEPGIRDIAQLATSVTMPGVLISPEDVAAAWLNSANPPSVPGKKILIDPENGRFTILDAMLPKSILVSYHYGFSTNIGAGTYDRREVEEIPEGSSEIKNGGNILSSQIQDPGTTAIKDSNTYKPCDDIGNIQDIVLLAANRQRPYLRLTRNWIFKGKNGQSSLCIDGLWIGAIGDKKVMLSGDFKSVVIRNCTFDPGGDTNFNGDKIFPVVLLIDANIDYLVIDSCIMGPLKNGNNGKIENVIIRDSIIQGAENTVSVNLNNGLLYMERVTVFGKVNAHRLYATETLITDTVVVTDTQTGCFRFSTAQKQKKNIISRLPRPYESFLYDSCNTHWFTTRRFGQPGYARLSASAPPELLRGAENGSEIGAFNNLVNPIKFDGLKTKIDEYMPFGLIPIFINET